MAVVLGAEGIELIKTQKKNREKINYNIILPNRSKYYQAS